MNKCYVFLASDQIDKNTSYICEAGKYFVPSEANQISHQVYVFVCYVQGTTFLQISLFPIPPFLMENLQILFYMFLFS